MESIFFRWLLSAKKCTFMIWELIKLQLRACTNIVRWLDELLKNEFSNFLRYSGYILRAMWTYYKLVIWSFFRILCTKNYQNWFCFWQNYLNKTLVTSLFSSHGVEAVWRKKRSHFTWYFLGRTHGVKQWLRRRTSNGKTFQIAGVILMRFY